jgi:aryl-alcohol dehydrogenase-like predicted oxidoreductase
MGTWQAGKDMWVGIEDNETERTIRAAFEAGITTFDTAEAYGRGHAERILGRATLDIRDRVIYATKVFPNHLQYDQVIASCHRSLKNLQTDHIDLYQIHWPSGVFGSRSVPIGETMAAFQKLREQGKIRAIGVSNFSRAQLSEAARHGRIDSLQPPYSLFWRHVEKDALDFCLTHQMTLLAYSPMAQGLLTGKFGPDHRFAKGDHRSANRLFQTDLYPRVQAALGELRALADRREIRLAQLALAWVISKANTCAIAGARSPDQIVESAAASEVELTSGDLDALDRISRRVTDYLDDNPVLWRFRQ